MTEQHSNRPLTPRQASHVWSMNEVNLCDIIDAANNKIHREQEHLAHNSMGSQKPLMLYGTAWKGKQTADLTHKALENGFTAIDTANYPTAYEEALTGDAIALSLASGLQRDDFYVHKIRPIIPI